MSFPSSKNTKHFHHTQLTHSAHIVYVQVFQLDSFGSFKEREHFISCSVAFILREAKSSLEVQLCTSNPSNASLQSARTISLSGADNILILCEPWTQANDPPLCYINRTTSYDRFQNQRGQIGFNSKQNSSIITLCVHKHWGNLHRQHRERG